MATSATRRRTCSITFSAAAGAAMGARRAQTAALLPSARCQWPLLAGKPTLATEDSVHRIGIGLIRSPEF